MTTCLTASTTTSPTRKPGSAFQRVTSTVTWGTRPGEGAVLDDASDPVSDQLRLIGRDAAQDEELLPAEPDSDVIGGVAACPRPTDGPCRRPRTATPARSSQSGPRVQAAHDGTAIACHDDAGGRSRCARSHDLTLIRASANNGPASPGSRATGPGYAGPVARTTIRAGRAQDTCVLSGP
jgi:hypothetical protein